MAFQKVEALNRSLAVTNHSDSVVILGKNYDSHQNTASDKKFRKIK